MLATIRKPIAAELERYATLFRQTLQSDNELLTAALTHLTRKLGKMMRPTLVLLCAREGGRIGDDVLHAATAVELLHTSSLVHDDVVDESDMRRGQRSVNALWDNKAAVLVGDFILSTALTEVTKTDNLEVLRRVAWLGQMLANGEIEQLNATHRNNFSEADYYSIIEKKTAVLFSSCAYIGALLGGAPSDIIQRLERFAYLTGLCFQMRDDLFDFDDSLNVGKPAGNDMQEGKLTLPVIHALNATDDAYHHRLALKVRAHEASRLEVQELVDFTRQRGGIAYAEQEMNRLRAEAQELLLTLRNAEVASSLRLFLDFVVDRNV